MLVSVARPRWRNFWASLCGVRRKYADELVAGDVDAVGSLYNFYPHTGDREWGLKMRIKYFWDKFVDEILYVSFVICVCFPEHERGESVSEWPTIPIFDNSYFLLTYVRGYNDEENGKW